MDRESFDAQAQTNVQVPQPQPYGWFPSTQTVGTDVVQVLIKLIKYLIEGAAVALAAWAIPDRKLSPKQIAVIAVTAAAVFAVLDLVSPAVSGSVRTGAGFGLGAGLVGGIPTSGGHFPGM